MKKQYLECGKIVSTHGIKGELKVQVWADEPEFILDFKTLYLDKGNTPVKVKSARLNKDMALLLLENIDDMDKAIALRGKVLFMNRDDVTLDEGDYFIQDLIDVEVVHATTKISYGKITEVSKTGANDVYHIKAKDGKERLIPAIPKVIISTDIDNGIMEIIPLEGLFDDED